ncbi:MAG: DNA cytosine methyltransferase [Clostridia bacterium]|nr:DNA cytosine methyltransferase [Clostridia bacterium]
MKELIHFSLFTGIGGIDLAAEWAGFTSVGQCEYADYPTKVLEKHWPNVPRWRDVRDVSADSVRNRGIGAITLLSGGFPCQPHSVAGKRKASLDERDLWGEFRRVISELRPKWVLGENVPGLLSSEDGRFFGRVLNDLASLGYAVGWCVYGAADVGALHKRDRIGIIAWDTNRIDDSKIKEIQRGQNSDTSGICSDVAYTDSERCGETRKLCFGEKEWTAGSSEDVSDAQSHFTRRLPIGESATVAGFGSSCEYVSDTAGEGFQNGRGTQMANPGETEQKPKRCDCISGRLQTDAYANSTRCQECNVTSEPEGPGQYTRVFAEGGDYWAVEPNVGRVANGVPNRVDRLKCLGNAVVPQQFYIILKAIAEIELS